MAGFDSGVIWIVTVLDEVSKVDLRMPRVFNQCAA
jgi:hypothetical protein